MHHPYAALKAEYEQLLIGLRVTLPIAVDRVAARITLALPRYRQAAELTGVPAAFIAVLDYRESNCNPRAALGQGDPWDEVSTHVPRGRGPFESWVDAAKFYLHYDGVDEPTAPWSMPYACWDGEIWNGFGPRNHGRHTGYLWAATNAYSGGKYVADGVWDPTAWDRQVGIVPILLRLAVMHPELAIGEEIDPNKPIPYRPPSPQRPPEGVHDARWVQAALNKLGADPQLLVDGSYGRRTRRAVWQFQQAHDLVADGLCGPQTRAAIEAALEAGKAADGR